MASEGRRKRDRAPRGRAGTSKPRPQDGSRGGARGSRGRADADVASGGCLTCPSLRSVHQSAPRPGPKMAAPSGRRSGAGGAGLWAALLLAAWALRPAEAVSEPTTVAFDVQPGGVVHSFSQNVGPGVSAAADEGPRRRERGCGPRRGLVLRGLGLRRGALPAWRL